MTIRTALTIKNRQDEIQIAPYLAGDKWGYHITLEEEDYFRPLLTSTAIFDSAASASADAQAVINWAVAYEYTEATHASL